MTKPKQMYPSRHSDGSLRYEPAPKWSDTVSRRTKSAGFPFQARFTHDGRLVTVLDEPYPGVYAVEGHGLVSKSYLVRVEDYAPPSPQAAVTQPQDDSVKPSKKYGFFTERDPQKAAQHCRSSKAFLARNWLEAALSVSPLPARTVLRLAQDEGISKRGLYRAKRYHKVKSVRLGGRGTGRRNPWVWHLPKGESL